MLGALASSSCLPNPSPAKCSYRNCYRCHSHLGEAHHVEDPVKLVVVIWVACLDILLPVYQVGLEWAQRSVKNGRGEKYNKLPTYNGRLVHW